ncbi:MAG: tetratricopeptide repeat protein [Candidatus Eremiobacteraeota bacterium]|nr:tetratricopeptide repeat protein [Candidatus Eremiobacteraeota bacterium]
MLKTFAGAFVAVAFLTSAAFAQDAAASMSRGDALFKAAQYRLALASYQRVVQLEPRNARAYHQIGETYDKLGMPSQAADAWEKEADVLTQGGLARRPAAAAERPARVVAAGEAAAPPLGAGQKYRVGQRVAQAGFAFVPPGTYECWAGGNYTFTDIVIVSRSKYRDNRGNSGWYSFDPGSQLITFKSGTFKDNYAKYMAAGRIGLAAKPEVLPVFFDELCETKR